MASGKKISVIIPLYNTEKYIEECINSARMQTYENLEIIVVDDGSTDSSGNIADRIATEDKRINVIHKENEGVSTARNTGLDAATGEYIAFLDSDDTYDKDALRGLKDILEKEDADLVYGRQRKVNELGLPNRSDEKFSDNYEVLDQSGFWKSKKNLTGKAVVFVKLYKAFLFEKVRFPKGCIHEDEAILWKIISQCSRIVASDRLVVNYRVRRGSITHQGFTLKRLDLAKVLIPEMEYFYGLGDVDNMLHYFGTATRNIERGFYQLEHTKEVLETIEELYNAYKPFAKYIGKHSKSLAVKSRMLLYNSNMKLYFFIRRKAR